jgi:YfiR/HmsC-like
MQRANGTGACSQQRGKPARLPGEISGLFPAFRFLLERAGVLSLMAALSLSALSTSSAGAQTASEYQLKAIFLQNFARFVDWPPNTFSNPHDPFVICVLGQDPFHDELERAVQGRTVNNRSFAVQRESRVQEVKGCQIVFVSASERNHFERVLRRLTTGGILTVGDADRFIESGGIINFVLQDGRIRCQINTSAAEQAHLKISSKLLGVAQIVSAIGRSSE